VRGRKAVRKVRTQAASKVDNMLLTSGEFVSEEDFISMIERAYKEQRFIKASYESFDALNSRIREAAVLLWAFVLMTAGLFLVDWGFDVNQWVVPIASTLLSVTFLLGWLPYETAAGAIFVLYVRPYDIGDKVFISPPGGGKHVWSLVVSEISVLSTRFLMSDGESHIIMNHELRKRSLINLNRSLPPCMSLEVQLPVSTTHDKVTAFIDCVRAYCAETPHEWASGYAAIASVDYEKGLLRMLVTVTSSIPRADEAAIETAVSRLFLFLHTYLQAEGISYAKPVQPVAALDYYYPGAGGGSGVYRAASKPVTPMPGPEPGPVTTGPVNNLVLPAVPTVSDASSMTENRPRPRTLQISGAAAG